MNKTLFFDLIQKYEKIILYGAGMVGSLVYKQLRAFGVDDERIDFVVSYPEPEQTCYGHKVHNLEKIRKSKDNFIVVVSTFPKNHGQLVDNLNSYDIDKYITVDDELFEELERGYISGHIQSDRTIEGEIDILFMSSDNNYSSGAFLCMVDLCREMIDKGIRPLVVLPGYGNAEVLLEANKIEYTFVQSRNGLIENDIRVNEPEINKKAITDIEDLIKRYHIRIVHNNSNHTYVGAVAARNLSIPYIWHLRENIMEQGFKFFNDEYIYSLINDACDVIAVSEYIGNCYPGVNSDRITCIYDGVDTKRYFCERDILQNETIKILMPGIMVPLKGQHQLINAAIELRKAGVLFDISFVGSGDADYLRKLTDSVTENELGDCVHFYERVDDLEKWYANADVVVVCSKSEAFGRVTVEAQLAGCVVVGAACGATVELVKDGKTGYLYKLDDAIMLSKKIIEIINNKEKAVEVARAGQKESLNKYDRKLCCNRIIKLYERILEKNDKCIR